VCPAGAVLAAGVCRLLSPCPTSTDALWLLFFRCSVPLPRGAHNPAAGHLLSRTVKKWKDKVKLRGWPHKVRGHALWPRTGPEVDRSTGAGAFSRIPMP